MENKFPLFLPWPQGIQEPEAPAVPQTYGILRIGERYDETLLVRLHESILMYEITPYLYYKTPYRLEILIEVADKKTLSGALVKILQWNWGQQDTLIGRLSIHENNVLSECLLEPKDSDLADYLQQILLAFINLFSEGEIQQKSRSNLINHSKTGLETIIDRLDNSASTVEWWQVWFIYSPDAAQSYIISHPKELYGVDDEIIGYQAVVSSSITQNPIELVMWHPGEPLLVWEQGTHPGLHTPLPVDRVPELLQQRILP